MAFILVVDDDEAVRDLFVRVLDNGDHTIVTAVDGRDGLIKTLVVGGFDLLITDNNMPRLGGLEMIAAMKIARVLPSKAIVISGNLMEEAGAVAKGMMLEIYGRENRFELLGKPVIISDFSAAVVRLLYG